jgi:hypothetical protein
MNWKVTYARPRKSSLRVWIEAATREDADRKSLEFEEVKCFLSEDGIYNKSIISEDTIIQERQTVYEKQLKPKA